MYVEESCHLNFSFYLDKISEQVVLHSGCTWLCVLVGILTDGKGTVALHTVIYVHKGYSPTCNTESCFVSMCYSKCGSYPPESCLFSLIGNVGAFMGKASF